MRALRRRHRLVQYVRHAARLGALALVLGIATLSLYAHYRAARALDDTTGLQGVVFRQIDRHVVGMDDPDAFLDNQKGTLWSMRVGGVDLTDPLAVAEMSAASRSIHWPLVITALVPVALALVLGRVFCSWICPAGLLFECADKMRSLLRLVEIRPPDVRFSHRNKYVVLVVGLAVAAVVGLPLFALVYPPAVVSRLLHAWVFGASVASMLLVLLLIVAVEIFVSPRWWCRTMCPGGALYGLLGAGRLLRVRLNATVCTGCRDCEPVCPLGLYPVQQSTSMECDNCGVCLKHCPERALFYGVTIPRRKNRRVPRVPALACGLFLLLPPAAADGHHILGLPHYAYKENYPQAPTLEYPATTGPYRILMTSYPGHPVPGEATNVTFYIKEEASGTPFDAPVVVRILQKLTFGRHDTVVASTSIDAFDALHKLSVTFPEEGKFIVELSMPVEGQTEVIPFLVVAGEPRSAGTGLVALLAGLLVFVVIVRAVAIKRRRSRADARTAVSTALVHQG